MHENICSCKLKNTDKGKSVGRTSLSIGKSASQPAAEEHSQFWKAFFFVAVLTKRTGCKWQDVGRGGATGTAPCHLHDGQPAGHSWAQQQSWRLLWGILFKKRQKCLCKGRRGKGKKKWGTAVQTPRSENKEEEQVLQVLEQAFTCSLWRTFGYIKRYFYWPHIRTKSNTRRLLCVSLQHPFYVLSQYAKIKTMKHKVNLESLDTSLVTCSKSNNFRR